MHKKYYYISSSIRHKPVFEYLLLCMNSLAASRADLYKKQDLVSVMFSRKLFAIVPRNTATPLDQLKPAFSVQTKPVKKYKCIQVAEIKALRRSVKVKEQPIQFVKDCSVFSWSSQSVPSVSYELVVGKCCPVDQKKEYFFTYRLQLETSKNRKVLQQALHGLMDKTQHLVALLNRAVTIQNHV